MSENSKMGFSAMDYVLYPCVYNKVLGWIQLGKIVRLCLCIRKSNCLCFFSLKCLLYSLYFLETCSPVSPHSWVKHGLLKVLLYMISQFKPNREELCVSEFISAQSI